MPVFLHKTNFLIFFLFCGVSILSAQNPHPAWRNYSTEDGLPSPEVHYCLETPDGYMWFATDNGLSRFDGYEFKNYGIKEGLGNPVIFYMHLDPQGRLWMATMTGELFYIEEDRIHPYELNDTIISLVGNTINIMDFYIDEQGTKFLSPRVVGILEISEEGHIKKHQSENPYVEWIALKSGKRWITGSQSIKDSIREHSNEKYRKRGILPPVQLIADSTYELAGLHYTIDALGLLYLKEFSGGKTYLFAYDRLFKLLGEKVIPVDLNQFPEAEKMLFEGDNGHVFLGFPRGGGLRKYLNVNQLPLNVYDQYLTGKSISHIFKDSKGNFWVTTTEHGVFFCPNLNWKIYDQSAGLASDQVSSIAIKNQDELYLGLRNTKIYYLNTRHDSLSLLPAIPFKISKVLYDMIYFPLQEELWVGYNSHAYFKNGKWDRVETLYNEGNNRLIALGKNLTLRKGGHRLWGGSSGAFGGIDLKDKKAIFYSRFTMGDERTLAVWESGDSTLWVGNLKGLFMLKDSSLVPPVPFDPVFNTRVEDFAEMSDSTLVIATKGQGILLKKGDLLYQIDSEDGLTTNMVENVYVDERDNIWVGTLNGLNKVSGFQWGDEKMISIRQFTSDNGLPTNEINKVEVWGDDVWVATTKGLVHMKDENRIDSISRAPLIAQLIVNGSPLGTNDNNTFSYDQNNVVFQYITINFRQNGAIPYHYRLLPAQKEWTETYQRNVNFSALESGAYSFEVQSQNEDGIWSATTTLDFKIRPPFWETGWFLTLIAAIIGWIAYRLYKYRTGQIRHEAEVVKQMAELERSALRAQMNPHFIFNCLNSISNFINKGDKLSANQYLSTFAKLIRGTLHQSIANTINLEDEISLLENYMKLEQMRFEQRFDYYIELADNIVPFEIEIPPMMAQPFIENAIIHGLSKKEEKGKIDLWYELENGYLKISIIDNGIGIEQSKKQKSGEKSLHKSVGMTITKKRLEMLSGKGHQGKFETEEIRTPEGKVAGTKVQVWIPLGRN